MRIVNHYLAFGLLIACNLVASMHEKIDKYPLW